MKRRHLLQSGAAAALVLALPRWAPAAAQKATGVSARVRPGDPGWPSDESWADFDRSVGGRLLKVPFPLAACLEEPTSPACADVFRSLKNPYYLGDQPGLTQTLGWVDAWTSAPSAYAVAAEETADVVAAVKFAREQKLRLVVKGGGHSYQGTSNAPDSLLIWTRRMNEVALHDVFVPEGCAGSAARQAAVTVGAGAIWGEVYDAVTTKGGRYVQGGGCLTVGVAGLIQSGGFGSFSKAYGLAAASLLEAEIVTADGSVRIANACTNPELFWALKGGGGGSFGVVTRLTLRTHQLPEFFGAVFASVQAKSDEAYRRLVGEVVRFYSDDLFNPHWGEQLAFRLDNVLAIAMLFQGLGQEQAQALWKPFFDWVDASPGDFSLAEAPTIVAAPARSFWDPEFLKQLPGVVLTDERPGAPASNVFWASNQGEAGQFLHGYQSAWIPGSLLREDRRNALVDALFAASRHWSVSLHLNKGLAGAPAGAVEAARDTATNPAALAAFALAISGAEGPPAHPGIPGHEPDAARARRDADAIATAMRELRTLVPDAGSYVAESDFFEKDWQRSFWGPSYARLAAVKKTYDPDGLFFVRHGVGSEGWSEDGFSRAG